MYECKVNMYMDVNDLSQVDYHEFCQIINQQTSALLMD